MSGGSHPLRLRRLLVLGALASALAGAGAPGPDGEFPSATGATTAADQAAGKTAARWLARRPVARMSPGLQADVVVALGRAGAGPRSLRPRVDRIAGAAPGYATTAGAAAKVALAAEAADLDPRRLDGINYVRRITSRYRAGRYGRSSFDQGLAMIALHAAGRPVPRAARTLLASRRGQGGWSFDLRSGGKDQVDTTALMVIALRAAGAPAGSAPIRGAMAWLSQQRNSAGGYSVSGGGRRTGANATALVVQAELAVGRQPSRRALASLRALQEPSGAIRFTPARAGDRGIATAGAVPALMGEPY